MKRTFTIKTMYETTEGYYMKYADGYQSICDKDYNDINPEELVGADATDMNIFDGDNAKAIDGLVSDKEAVERMIDNETYTREEWEALSAEEKDNAIEDYLIEEEEVYGYSYGERHVEWRTLVFTIDDDAKITNVEIK